MNKLYIEAEEQLLTELNRDPTVTEIEERVVHNYTSQMDDAMDQWGHK